MTPFTPISALVGGALIGISVVLLMYFLGRIAGISGILGSILKPSITGSWWRLFFIVGLILSPIVWWSISAKQPTITIETPWSALVVGGLLVGFGTRYGHGCTSGHGVCGIARLSPRSIVATLTFMACGIATVTIIRHLIGGL